MKYKCNGCQHIGELHTMPIKMGGLLCEKCRLVIFRPYVDKVYFAELERRRKKDEDDKKRVE